MIDWNRADRATLDVAGKIAHRAAALLGWSAGYVSMDIVATHTHGCPLALQALLDADEGDFLHDIGGINRHLDRDTGRLGDGFIPRYAACYHTDR